MNNSFKKAYAWVKSDIPLRIEKKYYCETRDIFQARLGMMISSLFANAKIIENDIYILSAIAGEIGNNSFDHNLGKWPDIMGIFFGYELNKNKLTIVLADRGQGILATLKRVKPELKNDKESLFVAFNEKISGRAPEPRGNGLKFVKESIKEKKKHLLFMSGTAKIEINKKIKISLAKKINGCLAIITN
ncbi:hypothetical protein CVV26_02170 [Candidatus Kuenenbacteria bacterium HGW-Kuenenbacteria-1]|uniref:Histidine kinase/HSP90-like ATPase domain-containing protein n=1 Tax=Candidatus Kuenenbacteria bacterium HGW-Kuenenbacteria-1 TaxID=2013812 RepID=A0A2N1UNA5_9BACT|nr:MAG: hypothetical protein CVV26_02170 [Candidatus Kuenenbacteria bacterium HGW-Kuenenbacteria-1]